MLVWVMTVIATVSQAAATLVVCSLFTGTLVFAPFHRTQFSYLLVFMLDATTLALVGVSPMMLKKFTSPLVLKHPAAKV
jgi:hypothetical protein